MIWDSHFWAVFSGGKNFVIMNVLTCFLNFFFSKIVENNINMQKLNKNTAGKIPHKKQQSEHTWWHVFLQTHTRLKSKSSECGKNSEN